MDEEKTITLVKELADTLANVAVGPLHAPRLYSTLLNAVIASETGVPVNGEREGFENGEPSEPPTSPSIRTSPATSIQWPHLQQQPQQQVNTQLEMINVPPGEPTPMPAPPTNGVFPSCNYYFQNDGEMGTVADISTFPPTMADHDRSWHSFSVDNIFSTTFWDNALVPGISDSTAVLLPTLKSDTLRYLGLASRFQRRLRTWPWRFRVDHSRIRDPTQSGLNTPRHSGITASADHTTQSHVHRPHRTLGCWWFCTLGVFGQYI